MFIHASVATAWCKVSLSPYFTIGDGQRSPLGDENRGIALLWQLQSGFVKKFVPG